MNRFLILVFCLAVTGEHNIEDSEINQQCELASGEFGVCVPFYSCNDKNTLSIHGEFIIDIRLKQKCKDYLLVCCSFPTQRNGEADSDAFIPNTEVDNRCGRRNPNGIVMRTIGDNDSETKFGELPWVVAILRQNLSGKPSYMGAGSLIHPQVVVTAAHIVRDTMMVRAGEWDAKTSSEMLAHQEIDVDDIVKHEKYNNKNMRYDIAMLFLASQMQLTVHVGVACLPPPQTRAPVGTRCLSAGWGKDNYKTGVFQNKLRKVEMPVVDHGVCQKSLRSTRLGRHFRLHRSFVCAGGEVDVDTCTGDGGAPLACPIPDEENRYVQTGIVSWGIGCGTDGLPGVYVDVGFVRSWIDDQMTARQLNTSTYTY